jgi:hypothetical protein
MCFFVDDINVTVCLAQAYDRVFGFGLPSVVRSRVFRSHIPLVFHSISY